jgi:hypothetical protein
LVVGHYDRSTGPEAEMGASGARVKKPEPGATRADAHAPKTSAPVRSQSPIGQASSAQGTAAGNEEPPLFTVFVADPRKRSDRRFARQQGQADAARIRESGALSTEDRQLVNAKLRFFDGEAKEAYTRQVKPALALVTRPEIQMQPAFVGGLSNVAPAEQERIRRRRDHTLRFFAKIPDDKLRDAYASRLQRYLDEGMEANPYWDLEMIEQIIDERAPDAPWREAVRQQFLAKQQHQATAKAREKRLPTLSGYWQNQFGALDEQTKGWDEGGRGYARSLLWKWVDAVAQFDKHAYLRDEIMPAVGEKLVFDEIVDQFELVLRDRDRAIQEECRRNPPGRLMKFWGDPCKPWFGESSTRGEDELRSLRTRMRIFADKDHVPYRDIVYWLEEFAKHVDALPKNMGEAHLQVLQTVATVQGAFAMVTPTEVAITPGAGARPKAPALAAGSQAHLPPGASRPKVGDIISPQAEVALGPQRVTAVFPEFELLKPVSPMPQANRALPAPKPPPGSAIVKPPPPAVSTATLPAPKPPVPALPGPTISTPRLPAPKPPVPVRPAAQTALAPRWQQQQTQQQQTKVPPRAGAAERAARDRELADVIKANEQRGINPEVVAGEAVESGELSARPTPGKAERVETEAGKFSHTYAEPLRDYLPAPEIPAQFANNPNVIPLSDMPSDLIGALQPSGRPGQELRLGVTSRVDRATGSVTVHDATNGIIYEIKPDTAASIEKGLRQGQRYANLANAQRRGGRTDWQFRVPVYNAKAARKLIRPP